MSQPRHRTTRPHFSWTAKLLITAAVASAVLFGSTLRPAPAEAYVLQSQEGQAEFRGFVDAQNVDVCWNTTLPPIWVEATRRALLAWNNAISGIRFRSYRPVTATQNPVDCDVFINNELSQFDLTRPGINPVTNLPILLNEPDGIISEEESNTRATGGRTSIKSTQGSKTWWITRTGFVKVNTGSVWMQGRTAADLDAFQSTMVHELGHVIGLTHTQDANKDVSVMYAKTNHYLVPQPDDIAGMAAIYDKVTYPQPPAAPFVTTDALTPMGAVFWDATAPVDPIETPPVTVPIEDEGEQDGGDEVELPVEVPVETPADETPVETPGSGVDDSVPGIPTAGDVAATGSTGPDAALPRERPWSGARDNADVRDNAGQYSSTEADPGSRTAPDTDTENDDRDRLGSTTAHGSRMAHPALPSLLALGGQLVLDLAVILFFLLRRRHRLARRDASASNDTPPVLGHKTVSPLRRTLDRV